LIESSLFEDNPETENNRAIEWPLRSEDPSVRYFTLTDLLNKLEKSPDVEKTWRLIPSGPRVRILLDGQKSDGGFGVHPYQKWTGAHWRLVSLVELQIAQGVPAWSSSY
jgi:hypothetical protein